MPIDYMNEMGEEEAQNPEQEQNPEAKPEGETDENEGEGAVLPISILQGKPFEPGDELVLRITHIGDQEVRVVYASEEKGEEEGKGETPEPPADMAESPMDRMMA